MVTYSIEKLRTLVCKPGIALLVQIFLKSDNAWWCNFFYFLIPLSRISGWMVG